MGQAPTCVGIIIDGNRRWARARGLPTLEGHRSGLSRFRETVRFVSARGVKHLIVYAFSTENWNRSPEEVSYLLELFRDTMKKELTELGKEGVRTRFIGQRERFSKDMQDLMAELERDTEENERITLWLGLSYGGRAEITAAANAATKDGPITEESLAAHLWTAGMPDPDIVIRTGGDMRLSNFLPWQTIYSELFFVKTLWPDFSEQEFNAIIEEFESRERRHGK